jgi:hypothetical protein
LVAIEPWFRDALLKIRITLRLRWKGNGRSDRSGRQRIRKEGAAVGPELAGCIDGRQEIAVSFDEFWREMFGMATNSASLIIH